MTTEKAIQLLHRLSDSQFDGEHGDERREALSMAVRALEGDGDTISRQQAIDALDKHIDTFDAIDTNYLCGLRTAMSILKEMPSAQPVNYGSTKSDSSSQLKLNNDLISRQDVLNELDVCDYELKDWQRWKLKTMVREIPSAQPERKKGKWITVPGRLGNEVECNKCHSVFWYWMGNYRFCPSCGADMRGEIDE